MNGVQSNLKGSGAAFLAIGIAFLGIGLSGQTPFIAIGAAFVAIGFGMMRQAKRAMGGP